MIYHIQQTISSPCYTDACAPSVVPQKQATRSSQPGDTVNISRRGREQLDGVSPTTPNIPDESKLDPEQQREVNEFKKIDREVRAHERAHMAAGAGLAMGGANFQYRRGPDGNMYAVAGEVKIDTSREKDPRDTIAKMQQVRRAALAPAQPSGQDRSVAARATQIEAEARLELVKENSEETKSDVSNQASASNPMPDPIPKAYQSSPAQPTIQVVA